MIGFYVGTYRGYIYLGYGQTFADTTNWKPQVNEVFEISLNFENDRKGYYNGQYPVNTKQNSIPDMSGSPIGIFKSLGGYQFTSNHSKIYNLKITQADVVTNNFIPCYRKSDNVIGMYDIVHGKFYTNQGTGTFEKGEDVTSEYYTIATQHFTYDIAQNLTPNPYTREGYTFTGWNTSPDGTGTSYTDGQSVTNLTTENNGIVNLYAEWEANQYKVKFNSNEGTGTMSDQSFTYGTAQNLTANAYTREGYIFAGWNTSLDGIGTSYSDGQSVNNLTTENNVIVNLYAVWIHDEAYFDGNNSSSKLADVTTLTNIKRFEKYTGDNSNVQTLINNGTAVKIDDNTTPRSIYAWYDENGNDNITGNEDDNTIYWWTDADRASLLNKSHYMWKNLTNAEYIDVTGIDTKDVTKMDQMFSSTGYNVTTFEVVGLNTINTSNVINMNNMFLNTGYNATTWSIGDIGSWNTSNVTTMQGMFSSAGFKATTFDLGNIGNWNTENVTNMYNLFFSAGRNATSWNIGNIGNWNVSKVTNMFSMFQNAGYKATTWSIGDLSGWTLNTTENSSIDMNSMFQNAGYSATTWNIGNIGSWNTSNVTNMTNMFNSAGYRATTWNIGDISNWNTSKVTSLAGMFNNAGYSATTWNIGNLERKTINGEDRWNTSNVTNMQSVFRNAGYSATTWNIGNIGNWNVSKVMYMHQMFQGSGYGATSWSIGNLSTWALNTAQDSSIDMHSMFQNAGRNAETWNIGNIGNWNTLNVTNMANMFDSAGYTATEWNIGNIGNWNLSNVTDMSMMFSGAGYSATTWYIGDLSGWTFNTTNEVNMRYMFNAAGYSAEEWSIGDISNWNLSKVTNMSHMFSSAGSYSQTWNLDLSNWTLNTTTDVTMDWMFWNAGRYSTTWSIGDISNWDTSKVTNMNGMFYYAGYDAQTWDSFNSLKLYANNISEIFRNCPKANGSLNIYVQPEKFVWPFYYTATSGPGIIVNYTAAVTNIDDIIAASMNSNVTKGSLINTP